MGYYLKSKCGIILLGRVSLYINLSIRGVVQLVERTSGGGEDVGSSPITPTMLSGIMKSEDFMIPLHFLSGNFPIGKP